MKNYKKVIQVFDLFLKSIEIGDKEPFFCITIHPSNTEIRVLSWLSEYSDVLAKIQSVYKVNFVADDSGDLCAEFNINNVIINLSFCN